MNLIPLLLFLVSADAFTGKVVGITDGDSIKVLRDRQQITIRLEGIDSPELGQPYGRKAKQQASELAFNKSVTVKPKGKDRYGRTLADVILPDGRSLNQELVLSGYAWWFRKYSEDRTLQRLEAEARENKRGLWADPRSIPPWDWRAAQRAKSEKLPTDYEIEPNGVSILALLPNPNGQDAGNETVLIGNSTTKLTGLSGWKLVDEAGNVFLLSGQVEPRKTLVVKMTEATMPLNNDGDTIVLVDPEGVGRDRVSYTESQVRTGAAIRVGKQ